MKYQVIMGVRANCEYLKENFDSNADLKIEKMEMDPTSIAAEPEEKDISCNVDDSEYEDIESDDDSDFEHQKVIPGKCVEAVFRAIQDIPRFEVEQNIEKMLAKKFESNLKSVKSSFGGKIRGDIEKASKLKNYASDDDEFKNFNKADMPESIDQRVVEKMKLMQLESSRLEKPKIAINIAELKYNLNMKRNFPNAKKKNKKEKAARANNTTAARVCRERNRLLAEIFKKESIDATILNVDLKRRIACLKAYAKMLEKLAGQPVDLHGAWNANLLEEFYDQNLPHNQNVENKFLEKIKQEGILLDCA